MKRKTFASFAAALAGLSLAAAPAAPPQLGGFLNPDPSGSFRVDNALFQLTHFGVNWAITVQNSKCVTPDKDFPAATPDTFKLDGNYKVSSGIFKLTETITSKQKFQAEYALRLTSAAPIHTSDLALEVLLPAKRYLDLPIRVNGETVNFKEKFDEEDGSKILRVKTLELPLDKGTLTISGTFMMRFQDNRRYNLDEWSIRIQPDRKTAEITGASLNLAFRYMPHRNIPVDLRKAANAGFADEVAGDAKGGWTDQGPENDLRSFPVKSAEYAGIGFDVIDPARNDGRSVIALRGKTCPHYPSSATVELEKPAAADYLYILNAVGWEPSQPTEIGTIVCEYDDNQYVAKSEQTFKAVSGVDTANFWMPRNIKNAAIGWRHDNPSARIGLYVTRYRLSGKPLKKITFESSGAAEWLIPAVTLSDRKVDPGRDVPVVMQPDSDWVVMKNRKDLKPGSILDFSNLLDAPAGKYGYVHNVNGRLEFEKRPGVTTRFYGANIAFNTHFMEKPLADKMVEHIARTGYNLIRFHHFDRELVERRGGNCTTLDAGRLDRMDYLFSALKERGIYTTIDLFMMREIAQGEFPENPDWTPKLEEYKALIFISDAAMNNFLEFAANLLNHVNPYTKLAWKEDPALITVSMINEDTLFHIAFRTPPVAKLYQERFDAWLAKRGIAPDAKTLNGYRRQFLAEIYLKGYDKLEAYFRKLGVRAQLTDQNYISSIPTTVLRERYDFVDNHFYWSHPQFIGNNWNLPAVVTNESSIDRYAGGLNSMFPTRIYGKPFSITEWDYVNPNSYAVEGAFLTGAYAALQDWSILCRFTYCNFDRQVQRDDEAAGFFTTINDPQRRLSEAAGLVAFLREDVKVSEVNYPFLLSRKFLDNPENPDWYPALALRLGLIGKTGSLLADPGKVPALPPGTRALVSTANEWDKVRFPVPFLDTADTRAGLAELLKRKAITPAEYDPQTDRFRSSTGELLLDRGNGTFQSTTPRSESFVLKENQTLTGRFAAVSNRLAFGAFLIAARDGKQLESSRRMLLLHLTSTRNTEQRFQNAEAHIVETWGKPPLLVRRGEAEITINRDLSGCKLYAVDLDGSRAFEVPMTVKDGKTRFTLKNVTPKGVFAAYELVAE